MAEPGMPVSSVPGQPVMGMDEDGKAQHLRLGADGGLKLENTQAGYETVAASQTDQALGATGAAGDYLDSLLVVPATTSPGAVQIQDGSDSAITVFTGGADSVADLKPFTIQLGLTSEDGAWQITTGTNVSVIASGKFT